MWHLASESTTDNLFILINKSLCPEIPQQLILKSLLSGYLKNLDVET